MLLFALTSICSTGFAQSQDLTYDLELFRPHADSYGYSVVQGASTLANLQLGAGLWINYSNDPLVLTDAEGNRIGVTGLASTEDSSDGVIESRVGADIQIGMGFTRFFSVSLDLPVVMAQKAWDISTLDDPTAALVMAPTGGLGDIRLSPKISILDADKMPIGLAVVLPVGLPTGSETGFIGEKNLTFSPTLAVEYANGSVHKREYQFRGAGNIGYLIRTDDARIRDVHISNALLYGLGLGYHPIDPLEIDLEFHGQSAGNRSAQNAAELLLGAKIFSGPVAVSLGGGTGLLGGIGAPDLRVYVGMQVAPNFDPSARDTDTDGVADGNDRCAKDPEDFDGYQDDDGCPELDNDADGREDPVDKCPDDPEDDDGYMDNDGCPDPDNDKDGVIDTQDRCPDQPETVNEYMDTDGCPDEKPVDDTDSDGYKDDIDRCPYDAEDMDNFEDEDGCPEKDNDGDAILDGVDQCPNDREIFNGITDEDGCPDEQQRVVVENSQIRINDVIYFDPGKATIQERSFSLLDEIAKVLVEHPEIKKVRVEGHTDSDGNDTANLKLSQARADSVMAYLAQHGVEAARLDAAGFGEMKPIVPNDTPDNKAKNRRVEFIIVERD